MVPSALITLVWEEVKKHNLSLKQFHAPLITLIIDDSVQREIFQSNFSMEYTSSFIFQYFKKQQQYLKRFHPK